MLRTILVDDETPARERMRRLLREHADIVCVGEATHGTQALELVHALQPDLLFLDIQMPELDGLGVAASLPRPGPRVVFVTAYDEHALRAFELAATDYLLKPVDKERLRTCLDRVRGASLAGHEQARAIEAHLPDKQRKMAVRSGSKYVVFDVSSIAAVVSQDHYSCIWAGGRELLSDESLDKLIARLEPGPFLRVHRSAIVNVNCIEELLQEGDRKYVARIAGAPEVRIPISRERLDELKRILGIT